MQNGGSEEPRRGRTRVLPVAGAVPGRLHTAPWLTAVAASLGAHLRTWARIEAGAGRLLPWVPVAFGAGIALYFTAEHEPVLPVVMVTAIALTLAAWLVRARFGAFIPLMLMAAVAAGFATATLRARLVAHPVLDRPVSASKITGYVESREVRTRTDRFTLRVVTLEAGRNVSLTRVRLSVRKGRAPDVGSFVSLRARLTPPMSPLMPGSYDFARDLYFQGIGATGFVLGTVTASPANVSPGIWLRYAALLQDLRDSIDARIGASISGDNRAIATALLTGRRDAITPAVNDAMFISGLGHILSISGYHMVVVAGVVFFTIRALLALIPAFTNRFPIKKWAALAALLAAAFYLVLSGSEVATQRSFMMTALVLIGVMTDRRAITFRTLALAALAVLIVMPEALVHPSFQMSFAATLGLVALVEHGLPRLAAPRSDAVHHQFIAWGGREIVALTFASLIAGLATTPYGAFHFHRITPYGVLANLAAMPVVSGWVMPAGILGIVALPFGLDGVFWRLMDGGISWMTAVAAAVTALPGAIGRVTTFGTGALIVMTSGMIVLALLRSPLRWSGALLLLASIAVASVPSPPDILVAAKGDLVAVRAGDGALRLMQTSNDIFAAREWLAADADPRTPDDKSLREGVMCDGVGCTMRLADGRRIALARDIAALEDDCSQAAIVVTRWPVQSNCAASVIPVYPPPATPKAASAMQEAAASENENGMPGDDADFEHLASPTPANSESVQPAPRFLVPALQTSGALAIWRDGERFRIWLARPISEDRPWTRPAPARDIAARDSTAKDSTAKDSAARDGAVRDGAARSGAATKRAAKSSPRISSSPATPSTAQETPDDDTAETPETATPLLRPPLREASPARSPASSSPRPRPLTPSAPATNGDPVEALDDDN